MDSSPSIHHERFFLLPDGSVIELIFYVGQTTPYYFVVNETWHEFTGLKLIIAHEFGDIVIPRNLKGLKELL